jgi:fatty acid-binding protein DegV
MSYILSSVLSDDDKQKDMDRILGKLKNNWKLFMRRRDRRGFVGMSPNSNPNNNAAQTTTEAEEKKPVDINEAEISSTVTTPTTVTNPINGVSATTSPAY